jgi:hypothetical protein
MWQACGRLGLDIKMTYENSCKIFCANRCVNMLIESSILGLVTLLLNMITKNVTSV